VKAIKIISSGLTATELAALDWAFANGVEHGGWCPKDWLKKDTRLGLKETSRIDPFQCCCWNVWDADGIVIYGSVYEPSGICLKSIEYANLHHKPWIQLPLDCKSAVRQLADFIERNELKSFYLVGSNVNADEMKHLLPLILTDTFSDYRNLSSYDETFRGVPTPLVKPYVPSADNSLPPVILNPESIQQLSFEELYLNMYRTWEGNDEYAPQVRANVIVAVPERFEDTYLFHAVSVWAFLTQSNPTEAERHLHQIPEQLREHPFFNFLSESVYMASGDWEQVEKFAQKCIEWQPEKSRMWTLRGIALDKMGQTQVAYTLLLSALETLPNEFNFSYNLACFACRLGREDEAWEWVEKAFQLSDLETFKSWLLTDDDLKPLRERIQQLSQTKLV